MERVKGIEPSFHAMANSEHWTPQESPVIFAGPGQIRETPQSVAGSPRWDGSDHFPTSRWQLYSLQVQAHQLVASWTFEGRYAFSEGVRQGSLGLLDTA